VYTLDAQNHVLQRTYDGNANVLQTTVYATAIAAGTAATVAAITAAITTNAATAAHAPSTTRRTGRCTRWTRSGR